MKLRRILAEEGLLKISGISGLSYTSMGQARVAPRSKNFSSETLNALASAAQFWDYPSSNQKDIQKQILKIEKESGASGWAKWLGTHTDKFDEKPSGAYTDGWTPPQWFLKPLGQMF